MTRAMRGTRGTRAMVAATALVAMALVATALTAQDAPPPAPVPTGDDITVLARKMRKVRLNYAIRGGWLHRCDAEVSSGDPRVDRIMCAILRSCVETARARTTPAARACMIRRIDALDEGVAPVETASAGQAPPRPGAPAAPNPAPAAAPPRGDIVVVGEREPPAIVVTGPVPMIRGGLWRFARGWTMRMGDVPAPSVEDAYRVGPAIPFSFTTCLADGAMEAMVRQVAGEGSAMPDMAHCGRFRMTVADGRIRGARACTLGGAAMGIRADLSMSGRYDQRAVTITYLFEQAGKGVERVAAGGGWTPERPPAARWQVTASRAGDCPLIRRRDQRSMSEAVRRIIDPSATAD